jgi:hypothetical protein
MTTAPVLLPCPFCGWAPPSDLSDVLYPSGTYRRWSERHHVHHYVSHNQSMKGDTPCWEMNCTANMGGCGASISADSKDEAVAAWNRRASANGDVSNYIASLVAERDALAEDAERYRYLRDKCGDSHLGVFKHAWDSHNRTWLSGASLDAAIDAARLSAKEPT